MPIGKKLLYSTISTLIICFIMTSNGYTANLAEEAEVQTFINEMVKEHGFKKNELDTLFSQVKVKQKILDAISRPAEKNQALA